MMLREPTTLRASASAVEGDTARGEILAMRALVNEAERMEVSVDVATLRVQVTQVRGVVAGERRVLVVATAQVA